MRLTHLTQSSSSAEMSAEDLPLSLEYATNVASTTITVITVQEAQIFSDGFEDGTTDAWTQVVGARGR